jgi:anti-sigma-K factor RskA
VSEPGAAAGDAQPADEQREVWRWVVAAAALVLVAIGMIGALHGISTL